MFIILNEKHTEIYILNRDMKKDNGLVQKCEDTEYIGEQELVLSDFGEARQIGL
jgi:hypothetical protein